MLKIAHYVVFYRLLAQVSERCHCQKCCRAKKTETFGIKEVVLVI